jgi:hypothetical protein
MKSKPGRFTNAAGAPVSDTLLTRRRILASGLAMVGMIRLQQVTY